MAPGYLQSGVECSLLTAVGRESPDLRTLGLSLWPQTPRFSFQAPVHRILRQKLYGSDLEHYHINAQGGTSREEF